METTPISSLVRESDHVDGSDSDSELDDGAQQYYEPISAVDDGDEDSDRTSDGEAHSLPNGHLTAREAENGVSSLCLSDSKLSSDEDDGEEEEEDEEARTREEAESAAMRALREDEDRRNAPLATENAVRVMEAMRGISFDGVAPAWAGSVPETDWIGHLRRLRQPPPP